MYVFEQTPITHCRLYNDDDNEDTFEQPNEADYLAEQELFMQIPEEMDLDCLSIEAIFAELLLETEGF